MAVSLACPWRIVNFSMISDSWHLLPSSPNITLGRHERSLLPTFPPAHHPGQIAHQRALTGGEDGVLGVTLDVRFGPESRHYGGGIFGSWITAPNSGRLGATRMCSKRCLCVFRLAQLYPEAVSSITRWPIHQSRTYIL